MSVEKPEVIESALPDETPEMRRNRDVKVSVSPGAFSEWNLEHRQQLAAVLHVFGESLGNLSRVPDEARDEALRKIGFQLGPVMTETLIMVERDLEKQDDPQTE